MAISDVLFESSIEIRRYLENLSDMYEDVRAEVDDLLSRMDVLRAKLDTPPFLRPAALDGSTASGG
jgi:hypothetical protein